MTVPYALYAGNSGSTQNNQGNSSYFPASDSILTATSGARLTAGTFQVPSNERWLIESINVSEGNTSVTINGNYVACQTVGTIYNYYCTYSAVNADSDYPLFSMPGLNFQLQIPSGFQVYGGYGSSFNCNTCPPSNSALTFNSSIFKDVKFPIWLEANESITIASGVLVSITKYK